MKEKEYMTINPKTTDIIKVYGLPFFETERNYYRIRENDFPIVNNLSEALATLSKNTAGALIAFYTNTTSFQIEVSGLSHFNMDHMAFTGQAGFDLYIGQDASSLSFYQVSRFKVSDLNYSYSFFKDFTSERRLLVLYFPLYAAFDNIELIVDADALIEPCLDLFPNGRIVLYGSSITQGGCASRPGMSYPAIISRSLGYECLNYGFSGNGKGQIEMAEIIANINNCSLFVLDYEANADENNLLQTTLEPFIKAIRSYYQTVPILIITKIKMSKEHHFQSFYKKYHSLYLYQKRLILKLEKEDANLHFLNGKKLLSPLYHEATVDGVHPTDLGFYLMAKQIMRKIKKIL